jgi:hypothetical protein
MKIDLTVRAQLLGDHTCSALGYTVSSSAPVLALCRKLVAAGHDPSLPLEAWRGDRKEPKQGLDWFCAFGYTS